MKEVIVACEHSSSSDCPNDCRACIHGGPIAVEWTEYAYGIERDFIKHYMDKETVLADFREAQKGYFSIPPAYAEVANNGIGQKMGTLQAWLNDNFKNWWEVK